MSPPWKTSPTSVPPSPLTTIQDWLGPLVEPLTTVGIVVVLVVFILVQREEHRNRLIRLFGSGNLHITTEVIKDVSQRISRYLLMQFLPPRRRGCHPRHCPGRRKGRRGRRA